jgi:hypothetical protein
MEAVQSNRKSLASSFVAGSFAGACGIFIGHPFDTLKVRMQVNQNLNQKFDFALVRQLYRGILPPLVTAGVMQSILFFSYESCRVALRSSRFYTVTTTTTPTTTTTSSSSSSREAMGAMAQPRWQMVTSTPGGRDHLGVAFFGGLISGSMLTLFSTPISYIKIQQQVASESGMLAVGKECLKRGGIRSLYRGVRCQVILESPGRAIYLVTYEYVKMLLNQREVEEQAMKRSATGGGATTPPLPITELYSKEGLHPSVKESQTTRMLGAAVAGVTSWVSLYVFCRILFYYCSSFFSCLSLLYPSIAVCLSAFSDTTRHDMTSNHHSHSSSIIDYQSPTQYSLTTYYLI